MYIYIYILIYFGLWVAFPFSKGSSQPRDQTQVFRIAGRFFTSWATREALFTYILGWGAVLGLHWCAGFALVAASGGYSLAVLHELLVAVASPVDPGL